MISAAKPLREKRSARWIGYALGLIVAFDCASSAAHSAPQGTATPTGDTEMAPEGRVHDHTPRHGGVVGMSGTRHLEAVASADGVLRVYVTDLRRNPLSLDGAHGTATITRAGGKAKLELVVRGGALEARTYPFASTSLDVRIEAVVTDSPLLIDFTIPVENRESVAKPR